MIGPSRGSRGNARGKLLVVVLTIPALAFMCYLAAQYWDETLTWIANAHLSLIVFSLFALLISFYGSAMIFVASIRGASRTTDRDRSHRLLASFLFAQIGKYVPGRIWSVLLHKALMGTDLSLSSAVLGNLELAVLSLALAAGSAVAFLTALSMGSAWGSVAFVILGLGLYFMLALRLPLFAGAILSRFFPKLGHLPEAGTSRDGRSDKPSIIGLGLYGGGYCAGWLCFMLAGESVGWEAGLRMAALLSLSYVIGLISLLPAGVGAREAALLIIGEWWGLETATLASVAIASRLALLVVEFFAAILGAAMLAFHGKQREIHD